MISKVGQCSCFLFGRYMNFMFDLEDASNDGAIDAAEFAIVCSSYGLDKAECEDAFRKMSQVSVFSIEEDVNFRFSCRLRQRNTDWQSFSYTGCWRSYKRTVRRLMAGVLAIRRAIRPRQLHLRENDLLTKLIRVHHWVLQFESFVTVEILKTRRILNLPNKGNSVRRIFNGIVYWHRTETFDAFVFSWSVYLINSWFILFDSVTIRNVCV